MANYSQVRVLLSLRQSFHCYHTLNSPILRSSSHFANLINPNFRSSLSSPFFSTSKFAVPLNALQLLRNRTFNGVRSFATRLSESSSSNGNRPPKETIMLEGCDFEHWLVVVEPPGPQLTRDEIIDGYIKTLAQVLKSEEEARMKIYSVSTRHYFAFSALISEELGYKLKELPNVRWVLPDSYMDVKNKTYAGEPFINGQAVPYDPKYHEVWVRNNEESLRNNNNSRRRQRDPNPRSRSPTSVSAHSTLNENSSGHRQNQAQHTSSFQNQTSQPSSVPDPFSQQQNVTFSAASPNDIAQSSRTQNPSHLQYQAVIQAPPAFSQNQNPPAFSQNQNPPAYSQNQNPPAFSQNQNPPTFSQNQKPPAFSQNQNPPACSQNQNPPAFSHNQPPQAPHMQNHSMPWTQTPSQPSPTSPNSQDWGSHNHSWAPPRGHENQARHPSRMQNQTSPMSSTLNPYNPARNAQNENWETTAMYQSQPPQPPIANNNFSYNNMPPPASPDDVPYQGQNWAPGSEYHIHSPPPPNSSFVSNANAPPSAHARGMPIHTQNTTFHRESMPSQVQQNEYYCRNVPPHSTQSGSFSNGYPSQPLQQQGNSAYRDMQSSKTVVTPPNVPHHQNSPRWGVPDEVQLNHNSRNVPLHMQNVGNNTGYQPEPPHPSQYQQYQNNSRHFETSNASATPQGWNYQGVNPPMQNRTSPNPPSPHGAHSHQFQGKDMPRPMQDNEFQHNMGPNAQNVNFNGARMPNDPSVETVQTRDYQERDSPVDSYMYASK